MNEKILEEFYDHWNEKRNGTFIGIERTILGMFIEWLLKHYEVTAKVETQQAERGENE